MCLSAGRSSGIKKMREHLPLFTFINTESFDIKLLDSADIIIISPIFLSHKLYYKVINEVRRKKVPAGYISSLNEDLAFKQIKEIVSKHLKS